MESSRIIRTLVQKLFPIVLLFGFYLTLHGHLSPGGGFQGGVIIGTAIILLVLSYGIKETEDRYKYTYLSVMQILAISTFILILLKSIKIVFGHSFLKDFIPLGRAGHFASAGMMLPLNLVIGIMVAASITAIFYALIKTNKNKEKI